ncbi:MAG: TonB-dependent receptor [Ignavibacteriae bacterium HGW-Ignavibacteriae-3]|nr:MAG: TonB-dependent receptor [Ignavibacteriae bacterium HGW-Ignavibacteriae-3]
MKYLSILFLFLFITINLHAQDGYLSGHVYSQEKTPLNFVSVSVSGKNIGTTTDNSGIFRFDIKLDPDDLLVFSHIGYETVKITVRNFNSGSNQILLNNKVLTSQTILVQGSIGKEGVTPLSFSKIDRTDIKQIYVNQDIPELLSYQPSITFYSENGNGIGYNYLSIRGFDQRRISFSINGIPQNDPEDHNVYWLDFPDILESTELIQVQRGAGSGIIGYPAVGGSINLITSSFPDKPKLNFTSSLGSYNTRKYSIQLASGLVGEKYSFYTKLSQTLSSGYRNSSWSDFKSYHVSAIRYDENFTTQLNIYGGPIADGLAYTGLPKFAVKNKDLRRANYSYWEADNNEYTYALDRRPDEIENFSQPHFELLSEWKVNSKITINNAFFLVLGNGFFDYDGSWADTNYFRITGLTGFKPGRNPGNALIRAMVENKQWGWIPRISIKHESGELIVGGELRIHRSLHWGGINYAENLPAGINKNYRYYSYRGGNNILNFFIHENYILNERINFLIEGQLAYHNYSIGSEMYAGNQFEIGNLFFNPRFGINYKLTDHWNSYISFARVSLEPRLKNYYDAAESSGGAIPQFEINSIGKYDFTKPLVRPETMNDIELGTSINFDRTVFSLNAYYMLFNDEIVKQGQIDRFGQPVTGNMDRTVHYGLEAVASINIDDRLDIILNGSYSRNLISKGYAYLSSSNSNLPVKVDLSSNMISGFPDVTFNAVVKYSYDDLFLQASIKYVGKYFTDNYDTKLAELRKSFPAITNYSDNRVDPYFVSNVYASYRFSKEHFAKELQLFFQVNNVFDNLYAAYGIGAEFFPAAERNFNFGIKLGM